MGAPSLRPTAIRSSQVSPSSRHARSASVSPSNRASAFGEPKRLLDAADEQDPVRRRSATARCRRWREPPRTKPQSVMPRSAASSTARLDGAPTATRTGQPATAAFWTSSNESRPLTQRTCSASGSSRSPEGPADDLVHRVVAADVLAHAQQLAGSGEETCRVQAAGCVEGRLRLAQPVGQRGDERRAAAGAPTRRAAPRPRPPRARPFRRRRKTRRCRSCAAGAPGRSRARRPRPCSRRGRRGGAPRAAASPRRGRSRARAPRRAPASASSPRPARPRSGSRAAPRRRPGRARSRRPEAGGRRPLRPSKAARPSAPPA